MKKKITEDYDNDSYKLDRLADRISRLTRGVQRLILTHKMRFDMIDSEKVSDCCSAGVFNPRDEEGGGICLLCKEHCSSVDTE